MHNSGSKSCFNELFLVLCAKRRAMSRYGEVMRIIIFSAFSALCLMAH